MRLLLVRHALAGVRGTWPGDDLDRELDDVGLGQAEAIADTWADSGIDRIWTSRAERCRATVAPLAARTGIAAQDAGPLLEGTAPAAALAWLEERAGDVVVACSHGDVIGGIVQRLHERGTDLGVGADGLRWPKASVWELEVDDGLVVHGRLHPPPAS